MWCACRARHGAGLGDSPVSAQWFSKGGGMSAGRRSYQSWREKLENPPEGGCMTGCAQAASGRQCLPSPYSYSYSVPRQRDGTRPRWARSRVRVRKHEDRGILFSGRNYGHARSWLFDVATAIGFAPEKPRFCHPGIAFRPDLSQRGCRGTSLNTKGVLGF